MPVAWPEGRTLTCQRNSFIGNNIAALCWRSCGAKPRTLFQIGIFGLGIYVSLEYLIYAVYMSMSL